MVLVTAFMLPAALSMVTSTSTRSPGSTKPLTPVTSLTLRLIARMSAGTRTDRPPPMALSFDARMGSPATTNTFVVWLSTLSTLE